MCGKDNGEKRYWDKENESLLYNWWLYQKNINFKINSRKTWFLRLYGQNHLKLCKYISMGILFNMKFLETVVVIETTLLGGTVNTIFNFSIVWKLAIISLKTLT